MGARQERRDSRRGMKTITETRDSAPENTTSMPRPTRRSSKNNSCSSSSSTAEGLRRSARRGNAPRTDEGDTQTEAVRPPTTRKTSAGKRGSNDSSSSSSSSSSPQAAAAATKSEPSGRQLRSSSRKEPRSSSSSSSKGTKAFESGGDGTKQKRRRVTGEQKNEPAEGPEDALSGGSPKETEGHEASRISKEEEEKEGKKEAEMKAQLREAEIKALEEKLLQGMRYSRPRYSFRVRVLRGSVLLTDEEIDLPLEEQCPDAPPDAGSPKQ